MSEFDTRAYYSLDDHPTESSSDKPDLGALLRQLIKAQEIQAAQIQQLTQAVSNRPLESVERAGRPARRRDVAVLSPGPNSDDERLRYDRNPKL